MRVSYFIPAFLATALASTSPDEENLDHLAEDEVHVFKRDFGAITARDIELAERDGVNLTEMYRHSVIKRDDGDHVTIWVENSFTEDEGEVEELSGDDAPAPLLAKRQKTALKGTFNSVRRGHNCWWDKSTYRDDTGPTAPYTGGLNAVISWGRNRKGGWGVTTTKDRDLIVAGSNGGANMRFHVRAQRNLVPSTTTGHIGAQDVGTIVERARNRYQRNVGGGMRVRAYGSAFCAVSGTGCFKSECWSTQGEQWLDWWISRYNGNV